jgi:hypothetical protein
MIYLRFWQWIKRKKTIELTPIIALPLASPVYPLKGEFRRMIVETP